MLLPQVSQLTDQWKNGFNNKFNKALYYLSRDGALRTSRSVLFKTLTIGFKGNAQITQVGVAM